MIPPTFLPPHFPSAHCPWTAILLIACAGLFLITAILTYAHFRQQRPSSVRLAYDPESASTSSPNDTKATLPPHSPPPTYTDDLPPPLRTTLHSPANGRPWTSADLISYYASHTSTHPSVPQQPRPRVSTSTQYFPLNVSSPPASPLLACSPAPLPCTSTTFQPLAAMPAPTLSLDTEQAQTDDLPRAKPYRRRRTLVFESPMAVHGPTTPSGEVQEARLATCLGQAGQVEWWQGWCEPEAVERVGMQGGNGSREEQRRGNVVVPEGAVWAGMARGFVEI
jgi:hypothetical protein